MKVLISRTTKYFSELHRPEYKVLSDSLFDIVVNNTNLFIVDGIRAIPSNCIAIYLGKAPEGKSGLVFPSIEYVEELIQQLSQPNSELPELPEDKSLLNRIKDINRIDNERKYGRVADIFAQNERVFSEDYEYD